VAIPNMALTLGEIFFLEELATDCAAAGRYAFLLVAPPLPVARAVGTPINPYALKQRRREERPPTNPGEGWSA
jgi:hypothetical protein